MIDWKKEWKSECRNLGGVKRRMQRETDRWRDRMVEGTEEGIER